MTTGQDKKTSLPNKYDLTLIYAGSILIAILMAFVAIAGLSFTTTIYPTEELVQAFVPNDVVNLLIGLPILIGSMWYARRGKLVGLLCWPGALIFVLYNYLAYVFVSPLSWAFLVYLTIVMLCVYTLIGLVASFDGDKTQQQLAGMVPEKFAGGVLVGFGFIFLLRVFLVSADAISSGTLIPDTEYAANFSDFFTSPAMLIGGILLWRRKAFGYISGLGLLFQASMLFIALILYMLLQPVMTSAPFSLVDVLVVFVMGLVCFIPFALFIRGAAKQA